MVKMPSPTSLLGHYDVSLSFSKIVQPNLRLHRDLWLVDGCARRAEEQSEQMGVQLAERSEPTVSGHAFRAACRYAAIRRRELLVAGCKLKNVRLEKEVLQWREWHSQH
jgi:hypothetical protein